MQVQVQAKDCAGSYVIDKCEQCTLYAPPPTAQSTGIATHSAGTAVHGTGAASHNTGATFTTSPARFLADGSVQGQDVVVVTCMSNSTNVCYSSADGEDMEEKSTCSHSLLLPAPHIRILSPPASTTYPHSHSSHTTHTLILSPFASTAFPQRRKCNRPLPRHPGPDRVRVPAGQAPHPQGHHPRRRVMKCRQRSTSCGDARGAGHIVRASHRNEMYTSFLLDRREHIATDIAR